MSSVRTRDTAAEVGVRRILHAEGFRFRLHRQDLPGKPDIALPKHKVIVLVHGCFWHAHNCRRGALPSSNIEFWSRKRAANVERDQRQIKELGALGWRVLVVWECELKARDLLAKRMRRFLAD
jgi:DNA mismatch endonuclease (patch repair protein)